MLIKNCTAIWQLAPQYLRRVNVPGRQNQGRRTCEPRQRAEGPHIDRFPRDLAATATHHVEFLFGQQERF